MNKFWLWLISPAVSGIVGMVGLVLGVYTGIYYERKPEISISIDALSKVFDLRKPVGGLEISYAGEDLRLSNRNLWVLTATIKNSGNSEIKKGDYDELVPVGLEFLDSIIAEKPSLRAIDDYIEKNIVISFKDNKLSFSPIILDAGAYFEVTVLLLGSDAGRPIIKPSGKIAGVQTISLITQDMTSPNPSVWRQAIQSDSLWVHLLRGLIYPAGIFFFFVTTLGALSVLRDRREVAKALRHGSERIQKMESYRRYKNQNKEAKFISDVYIEEGMNGLALILRYLAKNGSDGYSSMGAIGLGQGNANEIMVCMDFRQFSIVKIDDLLGKIGVAGDNYGFFASREFLEAFDDVCRYLGIDRDRLLRMPLVYHNVKVAGALKTIPGQ